MARVFQVANWPLKKAILLLINNLDAGHGVRTVLNWYMKENGSDHKDGECDRNGAKELDHPLCLPVAEQPPVLTLMTVQ